MTTSEVLRSFNHLCWYPSAGADFREVLFLSDCFYDHISTRFDHPYPDDADRILPDLFILTDREPYNAAWCDMGVCVETESDIRKLNDGNYADMRVLYRGAWRGYKTERRTEIKAIRTPVRCSDADAYFMPVRVVSHYYGVRSEWTTNLLYVVSENDAFRDNILLPNRIRIETLIQIRLREMVCQDLAARIGETLDALHVKYYIAEESYVRCLEWESGITRRKLYRVPGVKWSGRDDILWTAN